MSCNAVIYVFFESFIIISQIMTYILLIQFERVQFSLFLVHRTPWLVLRFLCEATHTLPKIAFVSKHNLVVDVVVIGW